MKRTLQTTTVKRACMWVYLIVWEECSLPEIFPKVICPRETEISLLPFCLRVLSPTKNLFCYFFHKEQSKTHVLWEGDWLSFYSGILILCFERKALSCHQPVLMDSSATNVSKFLTQCLLKQMALNGWRKQWNMSSYLSIKMVRLCLWSDLERAQLQYVVHILVNEWITFKQKKLEWVYPE